MIDTRTNKIMEYAYNLWNKGAKEIVTKYFPVPFKHIFNEDHVDYVDKKYNQALKLDLKTDQINDRLAFGDSTDKSSKKVSWQIIPVWENNELTFKLYNVEHDMFIKLDANVDNLGTDGLGGSTNSNESRHRFTLEPFIVDDKLVFVIINYRYGQGLKLDANANAEGDRLLWGHNGDARANYDRFKWIIEAWKNYTLN
ncbi:LOW QUALITY PROTEIN: microvitellogenin-like [Trichoplusia ni]|uniref:LOW QUALITY PROTEIN: microvitellogenin-like n=1 Tax=Trichoplusia ni TaxID=7111 RepID=A0A7E5W4Q3_TRINI|nr:LOW QUALITY PROTEIN: microvitellogenin-like [Trichoplusia ni]